MLTPSAVGLAPSGQLIVGQPALDLQIGSPERVAIEHKRSIGSPTRLELGREGKAFTAEELAAVVLRQGDFLAEPVDIGTQFVVLQTAGRGDPVILKMQDIGTRT